MPKLIFKSINKLTTGYLLIYGLSLMVSAENLNIRKYPNSVIYQGSSQNISWSLTANLNMTHTDLNIYQNQIFLACLSQISGNQTSYLWKVNDTVGGGDYFNIHVLGYLEDGQIISNVTPTFTIWLFPYGETLTKLSVVVIGTIVLLGLLSCFCYQLNHSKRSELSETISRERHPDYYSINNHLGQIKITVPVASGETSL